LCHERCQCRCLSLVLFLKFLIFLICRDLFFHRWLPQSLIIYVISFAYLWITFLFPCHQSCGHVVWLIRFDETVGLLFVYIGVCCWRSHIYIRFPATFCHKFVVYMYVHSTFFQFVLFICLFFMDEFFGELTYYFA
jgi:hypothetical protein